MKKVFGSLLLTFVVIFSLAMPSFASQTPSSKINYDEVKSNLKSMGIESSTIDRLIKTLKNGGVIDADVQTPDQAVSSFAGHYGDTDITTYVYADGSRSQFKNEPATATPSNGGVISPLDISGGTCQSDSFSTVCTSRKVSNQLATYGFSFYADYTTVRPGYGYGNIQSVDKWNIWTAGGVYTNPSLRIITKQATSSKHAEARLSGQVNLGNSMGSITRSLSLIVTDSNAYSSWNSYY